MRVVVVGATGNAGTALLRALVDDPAVTSVTGIARRLPDRTAAPYRDAHWVATDVGSDEPDDVVVERLAEVFRGADAVVHLAWLVQPNRDRELLRRTNVEGTRRVAEAAVRAGVPHLVVASSVGAYARAADDEPHGEDWPAGGIPTSHYSVDKAATERVLDDLEREHPELAVARVRPALIFQADAGAEVVRLFLGPLVPVRLLQLGRPPLLPLPAGLRLQAVHAADLADAYRRIVAGHARGAFNVAADDVLFARDVAGIVDHGRFLPIPPLLVRAAAALAYRAHAVAADPGWIDMAMSVPVMDTTRVRTELDWRPQHTAAAALDEVLTGMGIGHGARSAPLHPAPAGRPPGDAVLPLRHGPEPGIPPTMDRQLFGLYLSDHLTGATAGLGRIERMARTYDASLQPQLAELAEQLRGERELYVDMLRVLGVRRRPLRRAAAGMAERLGRLKLNGRLLRRSPMTPVLESELMRSAVMGKIGGWQTLRQHAAAVGLDRGQFDALLQKARRQLEVLERLHAVVRVGAFDAQHP
ncbi:NAD-dependent epimerase/dehydratase family protein [Xylanimonas sp. McL0601]|uniref:NAD-dependent epimerase/dehydratase family protein n=1 Tax=Xylanimonas sp. McL0601 TaxID=3414739 RepID=UPI003CE95342